MLQGTQVTHGQALKAAYAKARFLEETEETTTTADDTAETTEAETTEEGDGTA